MGELTFDNFKKIPAGIVFASGRLKNEPEGLYMTDTRKGDELRWLAKKGYAQDWCIYTFWSEVADAKILSNGDKVISIEHINLCVPCDEKTFGAYRY